MPLSSKCGLLAGVVSTIALFSAGSAQIAPAQDPRAYLRVFRLSASQCSKLLRSSEQPRRPSWLSGRAKTGVGLVYASQPFADIVNISSVGAGGLTPAGQLTLGQNSVPVGLHVDAAKNLYVTISALFGSPAIPSVQVFPPGASQPSAVYKQGLAGPLDVAIDKHGTLYVADLEQHGGGACNARVGGSDGRIVVFAKGSMKPTATITDVPGCPQGIAVDASASLYVSYLYYPPSGLALSDVREYAYQSTKGTELNLNVPGGPQLGGLSVDTKGNLIISNVQDDATLGQLLTFAAGSKTPTSAIQYGGEGWHPHFFVRRGDRLFTSAFISENLTGTLAEFDYPSGRELLVQNPTLTSTPFLYGFAASP
ncbi:MAG: hypothetical protein ABI346_03910 [Candidatus Baltobacteraceae bacterium]